MKKIFSILITAILLFSCAKDEISSEQANTFVKFLGKSGINEGYDLKQTADGGYIVVGTITTNDSSTNKNNSNKNIYLAKTDKNGNALWQQNFGNNLDDYGYSIQICADGGYIIAGTYTDSLTKKDMLLLRTDDKGNEIWRKRFGGAQNDEAYEVQINAAGGFIVVGYTESFGNEDGYFIITDNQGNKVSVLNGNIGTENEEEFTSVVATSDGYVICGTTPSLTNSGTTDIWIYKCNLLGEMIINETIDVGGNETGVNIKALSDNSFVCLGNVTGNSFAYSDILYSHFTLNNDNIQIIQKNTLKNSSNDIANSLVISKLGEVAITGYRTISEDNQDIIFLKMDLTGNMLSSKTFDATGLQKGKCIINASQGGYVIAGSNEFSANSVLTIMKIKENGNL